MFSHLMIVILLHCVKLPVTIGARIFQLARKMSVFHMLSQSNLQCTNLPTNIALELANIYSFSDF